MKILKDMVKEEWRMHTDLFGARGFALFPVAILLVSVFLMFSFTFIGFPVGKIYLGALALLFFMGLNVGGLGFISDDMASNLLGDVNLLIFSSRTLPVSERFLVSNFLVKDLLYYAAFLVSPVALAPLFMKPFLSTSLLEVAALWVAGTGMFMLGVGLSFTFASLYNRGELYIYGSGLIAAALWISSFELLKFTPLAFFETPAISTFISGFSSVALFLFAGLMLYKPDSSKSLRSSADSFRHLHGKIGFDDPVSTKSLIDLNRSGGGLWKVVISQAAIFGFFGLLLTEVELFSVMVSAPGMTFALMMAIASVSTYNWLTRFDSDKSYTVLPLDTGEVMESKLRVYLLVSVPIAWTFTTIGAYLFGMDGLVAGLIAVPAVNLYLAGVVGYISGLNPNQMLFDAWNFIVFTLLVVLGLVPMLVLSLMYGSAPMAVTAIYVTASFILGIAGYTLYIRGVRRWT